MLIETSKLRTSPNNPRAIRENKMEQLMRSIAEDPELVHARPLIVNENYEVIAGNQRLRACVALGWKEVPCVVVNWDEAKQKRAMIKDNVSAGEWDWDLLANEWDAEELNEWGLEVPLEEEPVEGLTDEDDVPEVPEEPTTKPGDLWLLGDHRLLCGDSTKAEDVERLMDGKKATLIHADPPYGMGKEKDGVLNDNLYREKLDKFQMDWWRAFRKHSHDNASAYIWGNAPDLWRLWYKGGLADCEEIAVRNEICWDKKSIPGMKSDLMHQYPEASERCLYIQIGQQFIGNINAADFPEVHRPILEYQQQELEKSGLNKKGVQELIGVQMYAHWFTESQFQIIGEKHYRKLQESTGAFSKPWRDLNTEWDKSRGTLNKANAEGRSYFNNAHDIMRDTWEFSRVHGDERHGHATPKPVDMMERVMNSSCPYGDIVVEPFIGSGATLIGAEKTGRKCYGMELDPKYCDVVVKRWEAFTGKKAHLYNEEQEFEIITQAN